MPPTESSDSLRTTSQNRDAARLVTDATGGRIRAARLFSASVLAALGVALMACSSNSNSTSASTTDSVVQRSGTSSKTVSSVELPKKWSVTWRFDCIDPVSARRFVLTAKRTGGGSPIGITDQNGLGGGGTKVYAQTGTFDFVVTTTCTWHLFIGPASSSNSSSTTTLAS